MARLAWHAPGMRRYETGVDRGVLYIPDNLGVFDTGFPWNGLVSVTESPSGAEATPQYADNVKYLNLTSAEEFAATIEAFYSPAEFDQCDGTAEPEPGVYVGQQTRKPFAFCYRSLIGNELEGTDFGYKLHLVYNALAAPSEKARNTVNDSPEAVTLSWELSTTAVPVTGLKPTAKLTIDSTKVEADDLVALEDILYGNATDAPRMPLPDEVITLMASGV